MTATRRLAAILAADVAGYSRLMGADEEGTLAAARAHRARRSIRRSPSTRAHRQDDRRRGADRVRSAWSARCAAPSHCKGGRPSAMRVPRRPPHRMAHRHQSRRRAWSRATTSSATGSTSRRGSKASPNPAASAFPMTPFARCAARSTCRVHRHRRAEPQKHRPPDARLPRRPGASDRAADNLADRIAAARQAVDRGAAVPEYERRPGAGIFRRRHGRGDHHRALAASAGCS